MVCCSGPKKSTSKTHVNVEHNSVQVLFRWKCCILEWIYFMIMKNWYASYWHRCHINVQAQFLLPDGAISSKCSTPASPKRRIIPTPYGKMTDWHEMRTPTKKQCGQFIWNGVVVFSMFSNSVEFGRYWRPFSVDFCHNWNTLTSDKSSYSLPLANLSAIKLNNVDTFDTFKLLCWLAPWGLIS